MEEYKGYKITFKKCYNLIITKIYNEYKELIFEYWDKTKELGFNKAKDWIDYPNKIIR